MQRAKIAVKSWLGGSVLPVQDFLESCYHLIPPHIRYGKPYRDLLALYAESDKWTETDYLAYQDERLRHLILHAYSSVPYYNEVFSKSNLVPADIRTVEDIRKLPYLTADIIRKQGTNLWSTDGSMLNRELTHSSGSAGPKLFFYYDATTVAVERAQALRQLMWLGFHPGDTVAVIKGQPLKNPRRLVKWLARSSELRVSLVQSDELTLAKIGDALERYRPAFIRGWPSCLYILARWIEANLASTFVAPRFVITSSEQLLHHQKKQIERGFQTDVVDGYGQSEFVAYATQCPERAAYHVQSETCILELIPYNDRYSEIVGTCLYNYVHPFIRYRTGDLAIPQEESCSCGRKSPMLKSIVGRTNDLIAPGRSAWDPTWRNFSLFESGDVKDLQLVMESHDCLKVFAVPSSPPTHQLQALVRKKIIEFLKVSDICIEVELVTEIPPLPSGKRPLVVSRTASL